MRDEMGTFRVDVEIENPARPGEGRVLRSMPLGSHTMLSWLPAEILESLGVERHNRWVFERKDGTILERWTGIALLRVAERQTVDDLVFGEADDPVCLGWRTLSGLNLRLDPVTKQLADAGPAPAAPAAAA
jgi:hypothetical protein